MGFFSDWNPVKVFTNAVESVGDVVSGGLNAVGDVAGGALDAFGNTLNSAGEAIAKNPIQAATLAAAGYYFIPEVSQWIGPAGEGGKAVITGTEAGIPAGGLMSPEAAKELAPFTLASADAGTAANAGLMDAATGAGTEAVSSAAAIPTETELAALGAIPVGTTLGSLAAGAGAGSALNNALTAGAIGSAISGVAGAGAAKDAAQIQADAAARAAAQQQANFELINKQQAPYRAAGYGALSNLGSLGTGQYQMYDAAGNPTGMGTGSGYLQHQFDATDLAKGLAPNYDFMLQQGQMANQRAANVGGGALSGNTLQGLQRYTQDYAGNAYQNAFNNYQAQRQNIYNTLAGIAGIGQTGQAATNTAATNATNAATQLGVGSAAAQAAGTLGQTGAYTGAINNALNNYTLAALLQQRGQLPTG